MNQLEILFENDEIRIINKPYNLASQGGQNLKNSVDSLLEKQVQEKIFLVHRLDKETCGLMITAKSSFYANKWTNLISKKDIKKQYQALCFGKFKSKNGIINETLEKKGIKQTAVTKYSVLAEYQFEEDPISLVELTLETGRMHQIRKHLANQNCPIINDDKYGDFKKNKDFSKKSGIKKMMLLSKKLIFDKKLALPDIEIDYPEHFRQAIELFCENPYIKGNFKN